MIDFYYAPTPNGWKVAIMLEECGLNFKTHLMSLDTGDQFQKEFISINPNAKIPAIVDHDPPATFTGDKVSVFESAAILIYLGNKTGQFVQSDPIKCKEMNEWLFWQVGNQGPIAGQLSHFKNYAPKEHRHYGLTRYLGEYKRNLAVLEKRLIDRDFILDEYSICDILAFPWVFIARALGVSLDQFPNLAAWRNTIKERPAVVKAIDLHKGLQNHKNISVETNSILFNQSELNILDPS